MFYTSFVVITDTPGRLATFLVSRNIIKQIDPNDASKGYTGVLPGMEWVEVPNPIVTAPGDPDGSPPIPPTYDTRHVYLVKFAHESMDDQDESSDSPGGSDDPTNNYDFTKFGKWVKANSTIFHAPAGYTVYGEPAGDSYKINGQQVWLVRDRPERFGVWQ